MKISSVIAAAFLAISLAACGTSQSLPDGNIDGTEQVIIPGGTSDMRSALVALSTACGAGQPITWSYAPATTLGAGYVAARDGSVVNGLFTAPTCGSTLLGTKVNVVGSCAKADGSQTFTTTVVFSIQQEVLSGSSLAAAVVTDCGTTTQCLAANPASISPTVCRTTQTPFKVQLYTQLNYTCGAIYDPATPPTGLTACSTAISPGVAGPALCTSYTYSAWSTCSTAGVQTRTVVTSVPAGCVGGATPALSQTCTPAPDGVALWVANCQRCHGPIGGDMRGASAAVTQAAINNNLGGMGSTALRALTPAQVAAIAAANP